MPIGTFDCKARGGRALLNRSPHHSTPAIVAEIEDTREWKDGEARGEKLKSDLDGDEKWKLEPESTLQIADCDRSIAFEINFTSESERVNTLHKIDTMIETLAAFREAVADEQRLYVERLQRYQAEQKKEEEA